MARDMTISKVFNHNDKPTSAIGINSTIERKSIYAVTIRYTMFSGMYDSSLLGLITGVPGTVTELSRKKGKNQTCLIFCKV